MSIRFFIYYFLIYAGSGVYSTYLPVYFSDVGLSSQQIGGIMSVIPVLAIAGQYTLGYMADKMHALRAVLAAALLAVGFMMPLHTVNGSFVYLMLLSMAVTFVSSSHVPLSDALTLQYCSMHQLKYSRLRLGGTVGYALMSLIGGLITVSGIEKTFFLSGLMYAAAGLVCLFLLPDIRPEKSGSDNAKAPIRVILKDKTIRLLLLLTIIAYIPSAFHGSFYSIHLVNIASASGINLSVAGTAAFIALIAQSVFLIFADRIMNKIGQNGMLITSFTVMTIRWLGTGLIRSPILLIAINSLDGASNIIVLYCVISYLGGHVANEWKATGQAMFGICAYGIAKVIGNITGSSLTKYMGISGTFVMCAVLTGITTVCLILRSLACILPRRR